MSSIVEQIIAEHEENKRNKDMLTELKEMFEFEGNKHESDFISHMQKWKDAQPMNNMTVLEKLDQVLEMMSDAMSQAESMEEEVNTVQSAIDELNYYAPSDEMREARNTVEDIISTINAPKEQAEADMED